MTSITEQFVFQQDASIWENGKQFEEDLVDFFAKNGLEARIIVTVPGTTGARMMYIRRTPEITTPTLQNPKGRDLQSRNAPPSGKIVNKLTGDLNRSFIRQYPFGKKKGKK